MIEEIIIVSLVSIGVSFIAALTRGDGKNIKTKVIIGSVLGIILYIIFTKLM
ncbi:hypothetical protein [Oceanirhabdus sp. W0125-5]|uniref:hypothetical protein n=1 Tax=Oceanirhabdus sp. W0125-5 TaxID=2999116 RepID=UPI0022F2F923|nr:hypothetical protein [Oceanirhabdus sp. W0125-5]WBW96130.1 hypothetical protein OW730_20915 [Oceanirhabdus sp. W0125-5]